MNKKLLAFLSAAAMMFSFASCSSDKSSETSLSEESSSSSSAEESSEADSVSETVSETEKSEEEPTTVHVSPVETISSTLGAQVTLNNTIQRTDGSNTCKIKLSEFIEDGDAVESFTFIVYSGDGANIGTFKGGCGISVSSDCPAATDEGWYKSADFSASTQGTYGEITWNVPSEIRDYISAGGEVMLGYWWGNAASIRIDSAVCTFTRTREIPVDGQVTADSHKSVGYNDSENTITAVENSLIPDGAEAQAVIYNISSSGALGKFTGAFCVNSPDGYYQSQDVAVFTDSSNITLTWIIPDDAKSYIAAGGDIMLGYWWSEQPTVTLDSAVLKYSLGSGGAAPEEKEDTDKNQPTSAPESSSADGSFRSSSEIINSISVGWNLGNTLECYDYSSWTNDAETAWGNVRTTKEMISSVKNSGFNAIRIPVTWGDHMNGNTIDSSWLDRVQEVVDYAYSEDMFVVLNMHHDDYTWFVPDEAQYSANSEKLCAIWKQICKRFESYGDRLLFEGMNEPRTVGSSAEWTGGTAAEREVINKYEQDFVDTVRASGGNNAQRTLIVTSYAASADDAAVNDVKIPSGDNIILSVHYYAPWKFSDGQSTSFTDSDKNELSSKFAMLKQKFIDNGTPVIIGEFGCVNAASNDVRAQYYEYYISAAKENGIKCFVWDNGVESGESSFGIFNRTSLSWNDAILSGIKNGSK